MRSQHDHLAPLREDEWRPMTPGERVAHADEIAEAEQRGFTRGVVWATAECLADHATVANRIEAAARRFYVLSAEDIHHRQEGAA